MTRINAGYAVKMLSDKHLLAEHREIKRIPNVLWKHGLNHNDFKWALKNLPDSFRMGKGHVRFFYDKIQFLYHRYCAIHGEAKRRRFDVTSFHGAFTQFNDGGPLSKLYWNDWEPTPEAIELITQRINDRNNGKKEKRT